MSRMVAQIGSVSGQGGGTPPEPLPPGPPQSVLAAQVGIGDPPKANYVTVTWEAPVTGDAPTSYQIYRSASPPVLIGTVDAETFTYEDYTVAGERSYTYWVYAVNDVGFTPSESVMVTTLPILMLAPTLSVSFGVPETAHVSWVDNNDPSTVEVWVFENSFDEITWTDAGNVDVAVLSLDVPVAYIYVRMFAYGAFMRSPYSNTILEHSSD